MSIYEMKVEQPAGRAGVLSGATDVLPRSAVLPRLDGVAVAHTDSHGRELQIDVRTDSILSIVDVGVSGVLILEDPDHGFLLNGQIEQALVIASKGTIVVDGKIGSGGVEPNSILMGERVFIMGEVHAKRIVASGNLFIGPKGVLHADECLYGGLEVFNGGVLNTRSMRKVVVGDLMGNDIAMKIPVIDFESMIKDSARRND